MATIAGPDLAAVERWYAGALGYKVIEREEDHAEIRQVLGARAPAWPAKSSS